MTVHTVQTIICQLSSMRHHSASHTDVYLQEQCNDCCCCVSKWRDGCQLIVVKPPVKQKKQDNIFLNMYFMYF